MAKETDMDIKTTAKTVENEKTKDQEETLAKAKEKKAEADKAAETAKKEALDKAKAEAKELEKAAKAKEAEDAANQEELVKVAAAALTAGAAGLSKVKKGSGFLKGLGVGVLAGALIMLLIITTFFGGVFSQDNGPSGKVVSDKGIGCTAVDFENVILGEAEQHQELVVMEQPLVVDTTISKIGLGGWNIFSKMKTVHYSGSGVYTVDFKNLDAEHINVNEEEKIVTVTVPHAVLQYVILDPDSMEFEDTEKGFLTIGDIKLTAEDQNEIEKQTKAQMNETLNDPELFKKADEFAEMKCWETFQPLVSAVSGEYKVEIAFE